MFSVMFQNAPKPVFGRGSAQDPCGGAYDAPPDSYSAGEGTQRAEIPILWQTSWIFLKIPPGNLLD